MARIALGGFQHETNTFAPLPADYAAFARADSWPALARGKAMLEAVADVHLPIAGALARVRQSAHEVVPLLWCSATPSDRVTEDAFERISGELLDLLAVQMPVDAVYLDLHGAMVCEHLEDGEGELLRRVRALVGESVPIAVSLDLHANITEQMVQQASVIDSFRAYPHTDMGETGARTMGLLLDLLARGQARPAHRALHKIEFQIPVTCGCTLVAPAQDIYQTVEQVECAPEGISSVSFACGFPLVDIAETGPTVLVYGEHKATVEALAAALRDQVLAAEAAFAAELYTPEAAVAKAQADAGEGLVILADTQDNPGGGGASDTMGVFRALQAADIDSAVIANICDPAAAAAAHRAGEGQRLSLSLGEHSGATGDAPVVAAFEVLRLSDGRCVGRGPMYRGAQISMGPTALLRHRGIRVLVTSQCLQVADQAILQHVGIEPSEESLLVLKSSVHFRNHFQDIAREILLVQAPGPVTADLNALPYTRLRPGLRISPRS